MLSTWKCPSLVRRKYHRRVNLARNGPGTLRSGDLIAEKTARSIHNTNKMGTKVPTNGQSRFDTSSAINGIETTSETDAMTARCGHNLLAYSPIRKGECSNRRGLLCLWCIGENHASGWVADSVTPHMNEHHFPTTSKLPQIRYTTAGTLGSSVVIAGLDACRLRSSLWLAHCPQNDHINGSSRSRVKPNLLSTHHFNTRAIHPLPETASSCR